MALGVAGLRLGRAAGRAAYDGFGGATLAGIGGLLANTRVATPAGDVAVESLAAGASVLAPDGAVLTVQAVAERLIQAEMLANDAAARPVRIRAGAIGPGVPAADLLLGPQQVILLEGAAVAAASLIDGSAVLRDPGGSEPVRFVRVTVPGALLAEGVACDGSWQRPDGTPRRLRVEGDAMLDGNIARADRNGIAGWTMDPRRPGIAVLLEVWAGGRVIARGLADRLRPDLEMAGIGDGRCGFDIRFLRPLAPGRDHVLLVRHAGNGVDVPGSPLLLRRSAGRVDALLALDDAEATAGAVERLLQLRVELG